MKIILLSLLFLLLASAQLSAQQYDEPALEEDMNMSESEEDVESVDQIVIMRFQKDQEPQLVEITNPTHKLIVENIVDSQMIRRWKINKHVIKKVLKAAGKVVSTAACIKFQG